MAKLKTRSSLSPEALSLGQPIRAGDIREALAAHGYAVGSTIETLLSTHCYTDTGGTDPWALQGVDMEVWVPPHAQRLAVDLDIVLGSGSTATAEVTVTVGGGSATLSRTGAGGAQPAQATLDTSVTGTGWQSLTIEGELTSGTDPDAALGRIRVATMPIDAADLPDPVVE